MRVTRAPGAAACADGWWREEEEGGAVRGARRQGLRVLEARLRRRRDTAEAVLLHAKAMHAIDRRDVVDGRKMRRLWDTYGKLVACAFRVNGFTPKPFNVLRHEACHEAGEPPRGFVFPGKGCKSAFKIADKAWACGAAHGVERDWR